MTDFKPGQNIRCTITGHIRIEDDLQTVLRLMRQDPDVRRRLKTAQETRVRRLIIRSRGKRPWEQRERSAKLTKGNMGDSWTMRWTPHLAPDFKAIEKYLKVEAA